MNFIYSVKLLSLVASFYVFSVVFSPFPCSYIEKFTDFLRLFVSVHLRRIESYSQFPVVEFLALLFKYTFHQVQPCNIIFPLVSSVGLYLFSPGKLIVKLAQNIAMNLSYWCRPSGARGLEMASCALGFS